MRTWQQTDQPISNRLVSFLCCNDEASVEEMVQRMEGVTSTAVLETLEDLIELGLARRNKYGTYVLLDPPPKEPKKARAFRVHQYLKGNGPTLAAEIARAMNMSVSHVAGALIGLRYAGKVVRSRSPEGSAWTARRGHHEEA